jgi:hypothetical protein
MTLGGTEPPPSSGNAHATAGLRGWRALARKNWLTFGGIMFLTASVYLYTLYRMRSTAPGDLRKMLPLPPSDEDETK